LENSELLDQLPESLDAIDIYGKAAKELLKLVSMGRSVEVEGIIEALERCAAPYEQVVKKHAIDAFRALTKERVEPFRLGDDESCLNNRYHASDYVLIEEIGLCSKEGIKYLLSRGLSRDMFLALAKRESAQSSKDARMRIRDLLDDHISPLAQALYTRQETAQRIRHALYSVSTLRQSDHKTIVTQDAQRIEAKRNEVQAQFESLRADAPPGPGSLNPLTTTLHLDAFPDDSRFSEANVEQYCTGL